MGHVAHHQTDQVTAAQLAVDGEVEQGELADIAGYLQSGANGPDLPELQGWLLADQFALVPRRVRGGRGGGGVGHGLSPLWLVRKQKLGVGTGGGDRPIGDIGAARMTAAIQPEGDRPKVSGGKCSGSTPAASTRGSPCDRLQRTVKSCRRQPRMRLSPIAVSADWSA